MRCARLASLACALLLGCATGRNYTDAQGPRFAGTAASSLAADSLRIVTFNLHFCEDLDAAIDLLQEHPRLRDADILALQEMDEAGTERVARALGLHWVYYPATLHPRHGRNFGNAILARWPITEDQKVILPHLGRFRKTQRIAVAGTIVVAGDSVRVYSLHLGTAAELGPRRRRDQASAVVADAQATARPVIIAGDLNSHGAGKVFAAAGFSWPTSDLGATTHGFFRWDHLFLRGFRLRTPHSVGVVSDTRGASDHAAVWAVVVPDSAPAPPSQGNARAH